MSTAGLVLGRVAQLVATDAAGRRSVGTGYLVADGVVLTAAHVVDGAAQVLAVFSPDRPDEQRLQATSWWSDARADIAVLRVPHTGAVAPAGFGRLSDRAALVGTEAVGYPRWKMRNADGTVPAAGDGKRRFRDSAHLYASSPLHSNARERTLEIVLTAPPADLGTVASPWEGMSGAAVWVGDRIVGVIAHHHPAEGLARLAAVRIDVALDELTHEASLRLRDFVPALPADPDRLPDALATDDTAPTVRRPWMAPVFAGAATERPYLLAALVEVADPANQVVSVEGAGGFGKTTLAEMLCRTREADERFPGGLLWVSVGEQTGGARLADLIGGLCEALSGERPGTTDPQAAGGRLGELLNAREPTLLVVDDVWRPEQLAPFLIGGWPACRVVTTRNAGVAPRGAKVISIEGMTHGEAVATLTNGLGPERIPPDLLNRLVDATGRWALLLSLVNAALADQTAAGADVGDAARWILAQLDAVGPTAFDSDLGDDGDRGRAVEATLEMSLARLSADEIDHYLGLVALPPGAELGGDLLARYWGRSGLAPRAVEKLRSRLVRLRLVQPGWDGGAPTVRLHDVVRAYLRHRMTGPEVARCHERMVDTATELAPGRDWWRLPGNAAYLWTHLPFHLEQAGLAEERDALVCDLRWVEAKTRAFRSSVPAEIDLDGVDSGIARALRRSLGAMSELLTPVAPETAPGATLYAYLSAVPDLAPVTSPYRGRLLADPQLVPLWPVPDQPRPGLLRSLHGHTYGVSQCAYSPGGTLITTSSNDGTARLWDARTGTTLRVFTGHDGAVATCAVSPDETVLATGGHDKSVRLWDVATGAVKAVLTGHTQPVTSCAFTPDGTLLASAGRDRRVVLWDPGSGEEVARLPHPGPVLGCAVSADGTLLATACEDGSARVWDLAARAERAVLTGHTGAVRSCALSSDGAVLATTGEDGTVRLTDVPTGALLRELRGHTAPVASCAFSPDGALVASAGHDLTTRIWDRATGEARAVLANAQAATSCEFSPDGSALAVADHDWDVVVWQAEVVSRPTPHRLQWEYACAFAPDGATLATAGHDRVVRLWELGTGELRHTLQGHTDTVSGVGYSPDGRLLATASHDGTVRIWDAATAATRAVLTGHTDAVADLAFAPDRLRLVSAGHDDTLRIWDAETGALVHTLRGHTGAVAACAYSPDGTLIASASHDHTVRVWDAATGAELRTLTGHTDLVSGCAFSADGTLIASASHDRTCRVWETASGTAHATLPRHTNGIADCAFGPDGTVATTDLHDCCVRLWRIGGTEPLCGLRVLKPLLRLAWHPDRPVLSAVGESGVYLFGFHREGGAHDV